MEENPQKPQGKALSASPAFFPRAPTRDKQANLPMEIAKYRRKEQQYSKVKDMQTISQLKQDILQQRQAMQQAKRENRALARELKEVRHQKDFEAAMMSSGLEGPDAQLIAAMARNGEMDAAEIRHQQRLWEHRHCQNGRCIHTDMNYEQLLELEAQMGTVSTGLSPSELAEIPIVRVMEGACSVCQSDIEDEEARKLRCGHVYHIECIDTWLASKKQCPICWSPACD